MEVKRVLEMAKQKKRNERVVRLVDAAARGSLEEVSPVPGSLVHMAHLQIRRTIWQEMALISSHPCIKQCASFHVIALLVNGPCSQPLGTASSCVIGPTPPSILPHLSARLRSTGHCNLLVL